MIKMSRGPLRADVCVIGSGAMGIAFAGRLAKAGRSVLLLEAGGTEISADSQKFYQCRSIGFPNEGATHSRFRVYGGSTERWGGQAMRFNRVDFAHRPWMNAKEWAVSFDEVANYYPEAEKFLGLEDPPYQEIVGEMESLAKKLSLGPDPLGENSSPFMLHSSVFMKQPRLREMYADELAGSGITLLREAAAVRLETDGAGTVTGLIVRLNGEEARVAASEFVLATGGVENARFLLIQKHVYHLPELAAHETIGRYFQDHPGVHVAEISGRGAALFQNVFRLKATPSMSTKGRLTWSERSRSEQQLVSVSGTFLMSREPSPFDIDSPKLSLRAGYFSRWKECFACMARGIIYSPLHRTVLAVSAEDVPDPESRIALSEFDADPHGLPQAVIDWRVSPQVADSIVQFTDAFERLYRERKWGDFRRFSFTRESESLLPQLKDNGHHIGSTSMGASVNDAVIDRDAKVFGFTNFHVAGTSVLPTGSHANPTLTALALCFRLADNLSKA